MIYFWLKINYTIIQTVNYIMKTSNSHSFTFYPATGTSNPIKDNFSDLKYSSENTTGLIDLHAKNHDEPDFDCEFLHATLNDYIESESITDPDPEEDYSDDYHDREWDMDIYDPYQESAYF